MSIYTNTKPYSYMHGDSGPIIIPPGTTFKLICFESFGAILEVATDSREKEKFNVNLDVFNLVFKEVDL